MMTATALCVQIHGGANLIAETHVTNSGQSKRQKRHENATWLCLKLLEVVSSSPPAKTPSAYNCWCRQSDILFIQLCLHVMKWLFKPMCTVIDGITVYTSDLADVSLPLTYTKNTIKQ